MTLAAFAAGYAAGARVCDRVESLLPAIDASDPVWIARVCEADVYRRARALDAVPIAKRAALPLFGIPFAVKDNIDVAGMPTTAACPAFAYVPQRSATAVERLEAAGAILIGKTNLDQFATGLVGTRSPYGVPVNPFDAAYIPGGSSSGSAVAVARGLVAFALGTDTAGSGRVPAAFNNIIGLKPTHGTISAAGVVPACRSLDCVSIFAPTVDDAQAVYDVLAAADARDPFSRARLPHDPEIGTTFRFAVPQPDQREFFDDDAARAEFKSAIARLTALGGTPVDIDMAPCFAAASLLYSGPFVAERTAAVGDFVDAHPDDVLAITRTIIAGGRRYSAVDAFEAMYTIRALRATMQTVFLDVPVIVVPSTPTIYRLDEVAAEPLLCNTRLGTYTNFVNLLDLCALAIPSGTYESGLPLGITLIGPALTDAALAGLARRFLAQAAPEPMQRELNATV